MSTRCTTPPPSVPKEFFPSPDRGTESTEKEENQVVHGSLKAVHEESIKLTRLARLYKALPEQPVRQKVIKELKAIWVNAGNRLSEATTRKQKIEAACMTETELKAMRCRRVAEIYLPELATGSLLEKTNEFIRDLDSVPCCPVMQSKRGNKGPTLLACYPTEEGMHAHVQKWSHLNEVMSNAIYREFSKCFTEGFSLGFVVPETARLDLKSHIHESASKKATSFEEVDAEVLRKSYVDLAKATNPELSPRGDHLFFSDLVPGQNFLDFSYTRYQTLSDKQKIKLFERLGRLAILDLIFGNLDRLVQVNLKRDNTYALDNMLEVNLGNVMVGRDDQPTLYSIDNGVDQALINDPEKRQKYLGFLRGLFSQTDPFFDLTTNFVDCFRNALLSQIDDVEYVPSEDKSGSSGGGASKSQKADLSLLRKQMEQILADLQDVAIKQAIDKGMKKMSRWMASNVVPSIWRENSKALRLQEYLSTHYPIYLEAINERLLEFQKLNPGPKEM